MEGQRDDVAPHERRGGGERQLECPGEPQHLSRVVVVDDGRAIEVSEAGRAGEQKVHGVDERAAS
eukprot:4305471-Karenia_brevis.AAC.1